MPTLIRSNLWRDGGSISAVVLDGQQHRAFWLETNQWDHPRDAGHENLFVSNGDVPALKETKIAIASAEERRWLDYLLQVDLKGAEDESKGQFENMLQVLQTRQEGRNECC